MDVEERIKKVFADSTSKGEAFTLFSSNHPLGIYVGYDEIGRKSMAIIMNAKHESVDSSKIINVEFNDRYDGATELLFSLTDNTFEDLFYKFCEDVIVNTFYASPDDGFAPVILRWNLWLEFFKKKNLLLSRSEIMGLIGELLFIDNYMLPKYGMEKSMEAYIGVKKSHKDFELDETWYEVKATYNGSTSVTISSLEQLDSTRVGHLEVVFLDEATNIDSDESISLNTIVERVRNKLDIRDAKKFDDKMIKVGYVYNPKYDEYLFMPIAAFGYKVENGFPRLTKDMVPNGVSKAKYEIDISSIKSFEEEAWI